MGNENTNRKRLNSIIAKKIDIAEEQADEIIEKFLEVFKKVILTGDKIELRNFGVFQISERRSKLARNLSTNETIVIPPKKYISFKPGKEMKEKVNQPFISSVEKNELPTE